MSAQQKVLLTVFYLCAFLALFAPVALASANGTTHTTNHTTSPSNTTSPQLPSNTDSNSSAVIQLSSTVALFGALVAAAVFTI